MAKIKNIKNLEQMDGKLPPDSDKIMPSRLEDVFSKSLSRYSTTDKTEYQKQLDGFTTAELREHAIKSGLLPSSNVVRLKKQLAIEFEKYTIARTNTTKKISKPLPKTTLQAGLDIMRAVK